MNFYKNLPFIFYFYFSQLDMHHIIGIDVGGTNTDTVVIRIEKDKLPQIIEKHKVPSQ